MDESCLARKKIIIKYARRTKKKKKNTDELFFSDEPIQISVLIHRTRFDGNSLGNILLVDNGFFFLSFRADTLNEIARRFRSTGRATDNSGPPAARSLCPYFIFTFRSDEIIRSILRDSRRYYHMVTCVDVPQTVKFVLCTYTTTYARESTAAVIHTLCHTHGEKETIMSSIRFEKKKKNPYSTPPI